MAAKHYLPLFPLHAVLFPGGRLPLRIFEPRYLDMVSHCMKQGTPFGVSLILSGKEVGSAATTYDIGTVARIVDWQLCEDGMLGISALGEQRFRIRSTHTESNQLVVAEIDYLPSEPVLAMPRAYLPLVTFLRVQREKAGLSNTHLASQFNNAGWVGYRLAETLPITLPQKQYLLQLHDPIQRLERICAVLQGLFGEE